MLHTVETTQSGKEANWCERESRPVGVLLNEYKRIMLVIKSGLEM